MNYKENFKRHYYLSDNNFLNSFFYFFGGRKNTYRKAIKIIRERNQRDALALDIENLRNDCLNVIATHRLEETHRLKNENKFVDACQ